MSSTESTIQKRKLAAGSHELENRRIQQQEQFLLQLTNNPPTHDSVAKKTTPSNGKLPNPQVATSNQAGSRSVAHSTRPLESLEDLESRRLRQQEALLNLLHAEPERTDSSPAIESKVSSAVRARVSKSTTKDLSLIADDEQEELQLVVPHNSSVLPTESSSKRVAVSTLPRIHEKEEEERTGTVSVGGPSLSCSSDACQDFQDSCRTPSVDVHIVQQPSDITAPPPPPPPVRPDGFMAYRPLASPQVEGSALTHTRNKKSSPGHTAGEVTEWPPTEAPPTGIIADEAVDPCYDEHSIQTGHKIRQPSGNPSASTAPQAHPDETGQLSDSRNLTYLQRKADAEARAREQELVVKQEQTDQSATDLLFSAMVASKEREKKRLERRALLAAANAASAANHQQPVETEIGRIPPKVPLDSDELNQASNADISARDPQHVERSDADAELERVKYLLAVNSVKKTLQNPGRQTPDRRISERHFPDAQESHKLAAGVATLGVGIQNPVDCESMILRLPAQQHFGLEADDPAANLPAVRCTGCGATVIPSMGGGNLLPQYHCVECNVTVDANTSKIDRAEPYSFSSPDSERDHVPSADCRLAPVDLSGWDPSCYTLAWGISTKIVSRGMLVSGYRKSHVVVDSVLMASAASAGGIKVQDLLLRINRLDSPFYPPEALQEALQAEQVTVTVRRDARVFQVVLTKGANAHSNSDCAVDDLISRSCNEDFHSKMKSQFDNHLNVNVPVVRKAKAPTEIPRAVPPEMMDLVLGTSAAVQCAERTSTAKPDPLIQQDRISDALQPTDSSHATFGATTFVKSEREEPITMPPQDDEHTLDIFEEQWKKLQVRRQHNTFLSSTVQTEAKITSSTNNMDSATDVDNKPVKDRDDIPNQGPAPYTRFSGHSEYDERAGNSPRPIKQADFIRNDGARRLDSPVKSSPALKSSKIRTDQSESRLDDSFELEAALNCFRSNCAADADSSTYEYKSKCSSEIPGSVGVLIVLDNPLDKAIMHADVFLSQLRAALCDFLTIASERFVVSGNINEGSHVHVNVLPASNTFDSRSARSIAEHLENEVNTLRCNRAGVFRQGVLSSVRSVTVCAAFSIETPVSSIREPSPVSDLTESCRPSEKNSRVENIAEYTESKSDELDAGAAEALYEADNFLNRCCPPPKAGQDLYRRRMVVSGACEHLKVEERIKSIVGDDAEVKDSTDESQSNPEDCSDSDPEDEATSRSRRMDEVKKVGDDAQPEYPDSGNSSTAVYPGSSRQEPGHDQLILVGTDAIQKDDPSHFLSEAARETRLERERIQRKREGRLMVQSLLHDLVASIPVLAASIAEKNTEKPQTHVSGSPLTPAPPCQEIPVSALSNASSDLRVTEPVKAITTAADFMRARYPDRFQDRTALEAPLLGLECQAVKMIPDEGEKLKDSDSVMEPVCNDGKSKEVEELRDRVARLEALLTSNYNNTPHGSSSESDRIVTKITTSVEIQCEEGIVAAEFLLEVFRRTTSAALHAKRRFAAIVIESAIRTLLQKRSICDSVEVQKAKARSFNRFVAFLDRLRPHLARKAAIKLQKVFRGHIARKHARAMHVTGVPKRTMYSSDSEDEKVICLKQTLFWLRSRTALQRWREAALDQRELRMLAGKGKDHDEKFTTTAHVQVSVQLPDANTNAPVESSEAHIPAQEAAKNSFVSAEATASDANLDADLDLEAFGICRACRCMICRCCRNKVDEPVALQGNQGSFKETASSIHIQRVFRGFLGRAAAARLHQDINFLRRCRAAIKIQSRFRGWKLRSKLEPTTLEKLSGLRKYLDGISRSDLHSFAMALKKDKDRTITMQETDSSTPDGLCTSSKDVQAKSTKRQTKQPHARKVPQQSQTLQDKHSTMRTTTFSLKKSLTAVTPAVIKRSESGALSDHSREVKSLSATESAHQKRHFVTAATAKQVLERNAALEKELKMAKDELLRLRSEKESVNSAEKYEKGNSGEHETMVDDKIPSMSVHSHGQDSNSESVCNGQPSEIVPAPAHRKTDPDYLGDGVSCRSKGMSSAVLKKLNLRGGRKQTSFSNKSASGDAGIRDVHKRDAVPSKKAHAAQSLHDAEIQEPSKVSGTIRSQTVGRLNAVEPTSVEDAEPRGIVATLQENQNDLEATSEPAVEDEDVSIEVLQARRADLEDRMRRAAADRKYADASALQSKLWQVKRQLERLQTDMPEAACQRPTIQTAGPRLASGSHHGQDKALVPSGNSTIRLKPVSSSSKVGTFGEMGTSGAPQSRENPVLPWIHGNGARPAMIVPATKGHLAASAAKVGKGGPVSPPKRSAWAAGQSRFIWTGPDIDEVGSAAAGFAMPSFDDDDGDDSTQPSYHAGLRILPDIRAMGGSLGLGHKGCVTLGRSPLPPHFGHGSDVQISETLYGRSFSR